MKGASAAVYLRESKNIILHAERVLSGKCHSQKSRQGPKAPHDEVRRVEELVFVDDDAQRGEGPLNTQVLPGGHCAFLPTCRYIYQSCRPSIVSKHRTRKDRHIIMLFILAPTQILDCKHQSGTAFSSVHMSMIF